MEMCAYNLVLCLGQIHANPTRKILRSCFVSSVANMMLRSISYSRGLAAWMANVQSEYAKHDGIESNITSNKNTTPIVSCCLVKLDVIIWLWQHHNKSPLPKNGCSESICVACLNSNHNLRNRSAEAMNLAQNAHSRQGTVVALLGCQPPGWGNITVLGKLPGHVATLTTKEWKGLTAYPPWLWESEIQSFKTRKRDESRRHIRGHPHHCDGPAGAGVPHATAIFQAIS